MLSENIVKIYEQSFANNWDLPALTDYGYDNTVTYGEFATNVAKLHVLYEQLGVKRGDKIALIGKNTSSWITVFISTITYGAVIVPILQEFNPADAQHIVNHSDADFLFTTKQIWEAMDFENMTHIRAVFALNNFKVLEQREEEHVDDLLANLDNEFAKRYPDGYTKEDIQYVNVPNEDVMIINYTSGTTGFSKGVMITCNNATGNVLYGINSKLQFRGGKCLSFLPLAHAYGCAFDLLSTLAVGSHITLLGRIPSPKIIMQAMAEVKPNLVVLVPLVLEKVYRKQIQPLINKNLVRTALRIPLLDTTLYAQIRKKLVDAFGGNFEEVIVGGAPLNAEVEDFLIKIKFPFSVGYGMTECAPLISHTPWREFVPHSSGRILPDFMECRIDSADPENVPGEICVRGENVMKGYYKNPEATESVLEPDGWLHTGDMGTLSPDGTLFIRGRCKTMLLSASGQNVYPEEIEAKLNNMVYVNESLVVERDGKFVALIYPDYEIMDKLETTREQLPDIMEQIRNDVNNLVAPYERISKIQIMACEFEKTPKRSIKRFLYQN